MNKSPTKSSKLVSKLPKPSTISHKRSNTRRKKTNLIQNQAKFSTQKGDSQEDGQKKGRFKVVDSFNREVFDPNFKLSSREIVEQKHNAVDHANRTQRSSPLSDKKDLEYKQLQKRQSLEGKNLNESSSSIEYSSVTKVAKFDNAASLDSTPPEIISGSHVHDLCSENMKNAAQYGVQYEDPSVCDFPLASNNNPLNTHSFTTVSPNVNHNSSPLFTPSKHFGSSFRSSIGKRTEIAACNTSIIINALPGWKYEGKISKEFFLKDPTSFDQAKMC